MDKENDEEGRRTMTTNNITNATIILEFDNGEYAITGTTNEAVISVCAELLTFKKLPKDYFQEIPLGQLDIEGDIE